MTEKYMDYIIEQLKKLLSIDSPSGYTEAVADYLMEEYTRLGYTPHLTRKGGVQVTLGGEGHGLMLFAHVDTLGAMVAEIKSDGRLRLSPIGGLTADNVETENCRLYTLDGNRYEGTLQLINASLHVNGEYKETKRTFDTLELLLDEPVSSADDVKALGIMNGDYVCPDPRIRITDSGYIKSRYLDDKLSTAILLGFAKYVKEENIELKRRIYQHITVFEEVGHGGCASIPDDVEELLAVDMGCVGSGLECTEHQVSICVKDSCGPSHYSMIRELVQAAKTHQVDFAADVYPYYGSDVDKALTAGHDVRHALIGPGVYASHGYERTHKDGVKNTFLLLKAFLLEYEKEI